MAKKSMGSTCHDHKGVSWLLLIVGVLYLLSDMGMLSWWQLNWWTVLFIIMGLAGVMVKK